MRKIDNHPKSSSGPAALESPQPDERVYDQSISISGTIDAPDNREPGQIIRAWIDNICIGETRIFRQIEESRLGYNLLAKLPDPIAEPRSAVIVLTLSDEKETETKRIGEVRVELMPAGLRDRHYGEVVPPEQGKALPRENISLSRPPAQPTSPATVRLALP